MNIQTMIRRTGPNYLWDGSRQRIRLKVSSLLSSVRNCAYLCWTGDVILKRDIFLTPFYCFQYWYENHDQTNPRQIQQYEVGCQHRQLILHTLQKAFFFLSQSCPVRTVTNHHLTILIKVPTMLESMAYFAELGTHSVGALPTMKIVFTVLDGTRPA